MKTFVRSLDNEVRVVCQAAEVSPGCVVFAAWEPVGDAEYRETMTSRVGVKMGRVDTKRTKEPNPDSDAAFSRHVASLFEEHRRAYDFIEEAFPEALDGMRSKGTILLIGIPLFARIKPQPPA